MGYTTDFNGSFKFNKPLDADTLEFLTKLATTRRMRRDSAKLRARTGKDFGVDGEFYVNGVGFMGQDHDDTVIDGNVPPKTQPGLWCQWIPTSDGTQLEHDGGEKFYNYVEWLEYICESILKPRGYSITGYVQWRGEDFDDIGTIIAEENAIRVVEGKHTKPSKPKAVKNKPLRTKKAKSVFKPNFKPLEMIVRDSGEKYISATGLAHTLRKIRDCEYSLNLIDALISDLEK